MGDVAEVDGAIEHRKLAKQATHKKIRGICLLLQTVGGLRGLRGRSGCHELFIGIAAALHR